MRADLLVKMGVPRMVRVCAQTLCRQKLIELEPTLVWLRSVLSWLHTLGVITL